MKTHLRHAVVALTAACALLLVAAAPASASTHSSTTSTTSTNTITLTKTGVATQVIALGDPDTLCPATTLTFTADHTHPTGSITATLASTGRFFFPTTATGATDHFISVITGSSTITGGQAGTYNNGSTTTTATINSLSLRFTVRIYSAGSTSCTPTGTPVCTWNVTIHFSGTYTGNIASGVAVSDTVVLSGASTGNITLGGSCAAPFSTYTGSSVTVATHLHVTQSTT